MATTTRTRCFCSTFEFGVFNVDTDEDYGTDCVETTTKTFAMGHDAKLVGFMVRAELAGQEIRRGSIHYAGAVQAAAAISEALAIKAQAQLDAAKARLAKAASREAAKAARKSAKAATPAIAPVVELPPIEAMIKVGRWTYPAQIDRDTREATYQGKLGGAKTVAEGKYSFVN